MGWCPFCGGSIKPGAKTKDIYFDGRDLRIHKNEYREFQETGILKYLEAPRSFPLSQDAIDLGIIGVVAAVLGLYMLWMIISIGA